MRKVIESDIPAVAEIFDFSKQRLREMGINQWQTGNYPCADTVVQDIADGVGYVCEINGEVVGYMVVRAGIEPGYETITGGKWLTADDAPYATIHRIAVGENSRGKGVSKQMFADAEDIAKKQGCQSVRVDTHADNKVMQGLLTACGYTSCGRFQLVSGDEAGAWRLCYEKKL